MKKNSIFPPVRVKLASRYPNSEQFDEWKGEHNMSTKNTNKINVPEARAAMDKFKMEAASDFDVSTSYWRKTRNLQQIILNFDE